MYKWPLSPSLVHPFPYPFPELHNILIWYHRTWTVDSRVHSSQKHKFDLRDKQGHAAFRANKLVGEMFSTMLTITRPRPPVPVSNQPHLLFPSFQTRLQAGWGDVAVVVRGGAAILSPQSSVSAWLQTRPVASWGSVHHGQHRTRHHWTLTVCCYCREGARALQDITRSDATDKYRIYQSVLCPYCEVLLPCSCCCCCCESEHVRSEIGQDQVEGGILWWAEPNSILCDDGMEGHIIWWTPHCV